MKLSCVIMLLSRLRGCLLQLDFSSEHHKPRPSHPVYSSSLGGWRWWVSALVLSHTCSASWGLKLNSSRLWKQLEILAPTTTWDVTASRPRKLRSMENWMPFTSQYTSTTVTYHSESWAYRQAMRSTVSLEPRPLRWAWSETNFLFDVYIYNFF